MKDSINITKIIRGKERMIIVTIKCLILMDSNIFGLNNLDDAA